VRSTIWRSAAPAGFFHFGVASSPERIYLINETHHFGTRLPIRLLGRLVLPLIQAFFGTLSSFRLDALCEQLIPPQLVRLIPDHEFEAYCVRCLDDPFSIANTIREPDLFLSPPGHSLVAELGRSVHAGIVEPPAATVTSPLLAPAFLLDRLRLIP